ncbi:MXAN_2562 family outer membrane beta-barrel protein [Sorangium sp. So ce854]|uniref:MXAN_2562 family outer membrane beta-barrel protein n=1 Tax=Sorangium sp. So ce854 TaxID=3133322 RepID=UPI003F61345E
MNGHLRHRAAACLAGGAALLVASVAGAQSSRSAIDWRQSDRSRVQQEERYASPQSFAFELRFGPYSPEVDEELSGAGAYEATFGDGQRFYFGVEFDWLPLRIPYVGAIGPGFGAGITSASASAFEVNSDVRAEAEETTLTIMPMHLSAVLRVDELMRRTAIPIVPYAKVGLGMGLWYSVSGPRLAKPDGVRAEGVTWGTHLALGGMLALNWLDRRASSQLDESTGINHTYLFGEWMYANLDGIGSRPQMHVGTSTWVVGLALDM